MEFYKIYIQKLLVKLVCTVHFCWKLDNGNEHFTCLVACFSLSEDT